MYSKTARYHFIIDDWYKNNPGLEQSMEQSVPAVSNVEAFFNIFANVSEIAGIRNGVMFLFAGFLLLFIKKWATSAKYALIGVILAGAGFLTACIPLLQIFGDNGALALTAGISCAFLAFLVFIASVALLALPVRIAKNRGATSFKAIIVLSFLGLLVPLFWSVAMLVAHRTKSEPAV